MRTFAKVVSAILAVPLLLCGWYFVAADYGYGAVSGTYTFRAKDEKSTLILKADRTFEQDLMRSGEEKHSHGTWRRVGEGGIAFSPEFLQIEGLARATNGECHGEVKKGILWLLVRSINLEPDPGGPKLYRQL